MKPRGKWSSFFPTMAVKIEQNRLRQSERNLANAMERMNETAAELERRRREAEAAAEEARRRRYGPR
jgi:hypothetical protein